MSTKTTARQKITRDVIRSVLAAAFTIAALWPASAAHAAPYQKTVAGVTDLSRDTTVTADFLRLVWVNPGTQVSYLGRNDSSVKNLRAFVTATSFTKPAMTVDQYVALVGNNYPAGQ